MSREGLDQALSADGNPGFATIMKVAGAWHLTDRQRQRLEKYLPVGDPHAEVEGAWRVYQWLGG